MFASVGLQFKLHSWVETGLEHHSTYTPQKNSKIVNVSWCNDNSYIALLQENEKPQIVSSKDRSNIYLIHTITAMKGISAIVFKHNTKRNLAMGNNNGEVVIYDTKMRVLSKIFPRLSPPVKSLEFNCNDQQLGVLCDDSLLIFYDATENDYNNEYKQPSLCTTMKFHPTNANCVAVGCENGYVSLWDTNTSAKLSHYQTHSSDVTGIALSAAGKFIISGGKDYKICVIDGSTSDCAFRMNIHQSVTSVDLSPDDKLIAAGLEDGSIYLYDIRYHLQPLTCTKAHNNSVNKISFENGPRESNIDFNDLNSVLSSTSLNATATDGRDNKSEINHNDYVVELPKSQFVLDEPVIKNEAFEKVKKDLLKMVSVQMDDLENQLAEHCSKFQAFISNEFEALHNVIRERWDIFNVGDMMQIVQAINSTDTKTSVKSAINRKSNNNNY